MAEEPWNRVSIPFPGAVSSVRIHFSEETGRTSWSDANKLHILVCDVTRGANRAPRVRNCQCTWTGSGPRVKEKLQYGAFRMSVVPVVAGANIKALLVENQNVLQIINSELLQTDVRVLYELLYILRNSFRGNKTFKCMQQVGVVMLYSNNIRFVLW